MRLAALHMARIGAERSGLPGLRETTPALRAGREASPILQLTAAAGCQDAEGGMALIAACQSLRASRGNARA